MNLTFIQRDNEVDRFYLLTVRQLKCDGYIVKPLDDTFVDQINKVMDKAFSMV